MNRQSFTEYLRQPAKLYQLSLTELRGLVLEYPYAANLRLLLLLKTRAEGTAASAEELEQAAVRTFDRRFLYDRLAALTAELAGHAPAPQEEFLELRDLAALQEPELLAARERLIAESTLPLSSPEPIVPIVVPAAANLDVVGDEDELTVSWTAPAKTTDPPLAAPFHIPVHLIDAAATVVGTLPVLTISEFPRSTATEPERTEVAPVSSTQSFIDAAAQLLHGLADSIAPAEEELPAPLSYSPPPA
ncbi:MAG: hypothetical protein WBA17_07775, partial [Saprospiraceae bacterium]